MRRPGSKTSGRRVALATPRVNIVPTTPKTISPRGSIQAAIRLGAARRRTAEQEGERTAP